jgi:hypothetical protein
LYVCLGRESPASAENFAATGGVGAAIQDVLAQIDVLAVTAGWPGYAARRRARVRDQRGWVHLAVKPQVYKTRTSKPLKPAVRLPTFGRVLARAATES